MQSPKNKGDAHSGTCFIKARQDALKATC